METQGKLQIDEQTNEIHMRYLTFRIDDQLFGLSIMEIVQITQMQQIMPLPEQAGYIKGIINLRGQIIPVIDMHLRFGKPEANITERTCMIVIHVQGNDFGLIVDEVNEVAAIEAQQISAPPKISMHSDRVNDYLTGIAQLKRNGSGQEEVALLLHAGKILGEAEFASLSQTAKNCE